MTYQPETMTVRHPGGDIVITQAAFEITMQRYASRTLGNLRDLVNERGETEHKGTTWVQCIAALADFDHNVDGDPFSSDRGQREARPMFEAVGSFVADCAVNDNDVTLHECECRECRSLSIALAQALRP